MRFTFRVVLAVVVASIGSMAVSADNECQGAETFCDSNVDNCCTGYTCSLEIVDQYSHTAWICVDTNE
ncbi:hypothetical protein BDR03DRAFT_948572 [Suillus americanus]|nr:hypothetical protein BDR03DRAFT_948572 [Suillus americanus]